MNSNGEFLRDLLQVYRRGYLGTSSNPLLAGIIEKCFAQSRSSGVLPFSDVLQCQIGEADICETRNVHNC